MAALSDVGKWARFGRLYLECKLLEKTQNRLIALHTRLSPRSATPDLLSETAQDLLAKWQRRAAFAHHSRTERMQQIGQEILDA